MSDKIKGYGIPQPCKKVKEFPGYTAGVPENACGPQEGPCTPPEAYCAPDCAKNTQPARQSVKAEIFEVLTNPDTLQALKSVLMGEIKVTSKGGFTPKAPLPFSMIAACFMAMIVGGMRAFSFTGSAVKTVMSLAFNTIKDTLDANAEAFGRGSRWGVTGFACVLTFAGLSLATYASYVNHPEVTAWVLGALKLSVGTP